MRSISSDTPSCVRKRQESNDSDAKSDIRTRRFGSGFFIGIVTGFLCWSSLMIVVCGLILVFGSSLLSAHPIQDKQQVSDAAQRPVGVLRKDLKAFVKNSKSDDIDTQVGAVLDLCRLHYELVNDSRYEDYSQLQSFRAIAGKRLKTYVKELEIKKKQLARAAKKAKKEAEKQKLAAGSDPDLKADAREGLTDAEGNPYESRGDNDPDRDRFVSNTMSNSMYSMSQFTGGPVHMFGYLPGNFAPPWLDEDLINLIETTISPAHWKTNGGDGDLFWYDPAKALVITGTSEVHDQVSDMLNQLRFLSR